jgi:hypothetical protein
MLWLTTSLTPSSDAAVVIFPTRFSTGMLDSSPGCRFITVMPTIVSIQLDRSIVKVRLWWSLNKIQEMLHLVNKNQRGKSSKERGQ